jgi:hypothetical protein
MLSFLSSSILLRRDLQSDNQLGVKAGRALFLALVCLVAASWPASAGSAPATTTSLTVTSGGGGVTTVASGSVVTLTATVAAGATPVTTGLVTFCDATAKFCEDIHILGTAQLTSAGKALFNFRPGVGSHSYKAVFAGTNSYSGSASLAAALAVHGPAKSYATITATAASGANNYTLTAAVLGTGSAAPTGTVPIVDTSNNNTVLDTGTLSAGSKGAYLASSSNIAIAAPGGFSLVTGGVAVGDFNGDGIPDLALANYSANTVTILLGNGDGTFTASTVNLDTSLLAMTLAVGDFNGDGIQDLAVQCANTSGSGSGGNVEILIGNGDGTFSVRPGPTTFSPYFSSGVVVGDFNGDGIQDLAVAAQLVTSNPNSGGVYMFFGNGDGTFTAGGVLAPGPQRFAVADFNGDGILDVAEALQLNGGLSIALGNGDGTFKAASQSVASLSSDSIYTIAVADFNGDGIPDLVVGGEGIGGGATVTVLMGKGDGTFTIAPSSPGFVLPQSDEVNSIVVADFNGDGIPDLAVIEDNPTTSLSTGLVNTYTATIFLGNGDGTFSQGPSTVLQTAFYAPTAATSDFNEDGAPDLAVVGPNPTNSSGEVSILLTASEESTATASSVFLSPGTTHAIVATYAGDTNFAGSTSPALNLNTGPVTTSLTLSSSANSADYADAVTLTATLSPYSTPGASSNGSTVTFSSGGTTLGTGTLSSGVATLTTTALQAGTDPIQASYAGNGDLSASTSTAFSLTVKPATLTVNAFNASRAYGAPNPPLTGTVSGEVNGDTFSVNVSTTATQASPVGAYPVVPSASGADLADYSVNTVNGTLTVSQATPSVTVTPSSSSITTAQGLTATVTVSLTSGSPAPSGTVTLTSGSYTSAATNLQSGSAAISIPAGSLATGTDTLTASYSGDANDNANMGAASIIVTVPPAIGVTGSAVSVAPGATTGNNSTITVTPTGGFAGIVVLTAAVTSSPSGAQYPPTLSFGATNPVNIAGNSAGTATLTISTTAPTNSALVQPNRPGIPWYAAGGAALACMLLFGIPARRRSWRTMLALLALLVTLTAGVGACGGSNSGKGGGGGIAGTTAGNYTVTVTAASGSISATGAVTLTVQ